MESICAKVPILAWPMMAEQPLNAKMIVEEIGIGLRIETSDGSMNGFMKWKKLKKLMKELIEGEMGKELGRKYGNRLLLPSESFLIWRPKLSFLSPQYYLGNETDVVEIKRIC
ncbi:Glycosyltransferase [Forsythia ovata]|uniref:Glycosyltransferase n=1 Tax=Forsythia ovata TaxID=205694 RepID=A0ABD1WXQ2_9LAMI